MISANYFYLSRLHLSPNIARMVRAPDTARVVKGKIERVLANHADGRHRHFNGARPVMGVAEHQIRRDLILHQTVLLGEFRQNPDFPPLFQ